MIISLVVVLLVTTGGTLATYLYDDDAPFAARLCAGVCVGISALGLVCFLLAKFFGLTTVTIVFATVIVTVLPFTFFNTARRQFAQQDLRATYNRITRQLLHPAEISWGYIGFYLILAAILGGCFQRAMIELPEGIFTGVLNNFGDLPFHISVITSFAYGHNFQPEDPTYAGVKFTYPFLSDFISAIFVSCGASLRQSMFLGNFPVALAFVGLLHRWAIVLLRDRLAAVITPLVVILNGGFGWVFLVKAAQASDGTFGSMLTNLPSSFTIIPDTTWRWGNAVSTLLIPQRGFLLGLPLAVIVFTQWWLGTAHDEHSVRVEPVAAARNKRGKKRKPESQRNFQITSMHRMIAAGVIAGLLPLVHAHSFVAIMVVGAGIALLQRRWRDWFVFFVAASVVALPQMWWSTHNSAVNAATFFEWEIGWDHGKENVLWFWFKNTGLFIPLLISAIVWRNQKPLVTRALLFFYLPFTLCFVVPNFVKMAPWIWDNVKILYYWWVASAPLVALLLAHLWRRGFVPRLISVILFTCVIAAGALDVALILLRPTKLQIFDASGISFAEVIKAKAPPRALILHAPVHNHPVFLTGRPSLMGYPGHIWTHGLDFTEREKEIRRVYAGTLDSPDILRRYDVSYIVVGPLERSQMKISEQFFSRLEIAGEVGGYRLYKIAQQ